MQYILFLSSLDIENTLKSTLCIMREGERERELKVRRLMSSEYGGKRELANGGSRRETRLGHGEGQTYDIYGLASCMQDLRTKGEGERGEGGRISQRMFYHFLRNTLGGRR